MAESLSLQQLSKRLRIICQLLLVLAPLFTLSFWLFLNYFPPSMLHKMLPLVLDRDLSFWLRMAGFTVSLIPLSFVIYGLMSLVHLFRLYEKGEVFEKENAACLKAIGWTMILWTFTRVVYVAILGIVLSWQNLPGERMLIIEFGLDLSLLAGLVMLVLAKVMLLGYEINQDYSKVI